MSLDLVTAGESHGPALVAVMNAPPAGLTLDRATIDEDTGARSLVEAAELALTGSA